MTVRRAGAITTVTALVLGLVGVGPAPEVVGYPAPAALPALTATTVDDRYARTQQAVREALAVAEAGSDQPRAATLESLLGRQLLEFDPRGNGRVVEVLGDLAGAERIAVLVPGSHTTLDTFDRNRGPGGGARALAGQIRALAPGARVAVVAWLGYRTPGISLAAVTNWRAEAGAAALRATVAEIRAVNRNAPVSLLCHSYGSVVCGSAVAAGLAVTDLAVYGSPGVGAAGRAGELAAASRVWAGRAAGDLIRFVPFVRVAGLGFGTDPVAPEFGARRFAAGTGGHGDYHLAGGVALRSLALIALGTPASGWSVAEPAVKRAAEDTPASGWSVAEPAVKRAAEGTVQAVPGA